VRFLPGTRRGLRERGIGCSGVYKEDSECFFSYQAEERPTTFEPRTRVTTWNIWNLKEVREFANVRSNVGGSAG